MTQQDKFTAQVKEKLLSSIAAQIDAIGFVPQELARLVAGADLGAANPEPDQASTQANDKEQLADFVNYHYDDMFYDPQVNFERGLGKTDFKNIGYWDDTTHSLHEASVRLHERLLDAIPHKTGRVLDVACGMGASTRRLLDFYPAENIWAINISDKQIASTRKNAPGCNALVMNAVDLQFEDSFFDAVMCIEAAMHFETRRKFLEEAARVLKDGGRLSLSDILFTPAERLAQFPMFPSPENHLATVEEYRALLADIGFKDIVVEDAREAVWERHFLFVVNNIHRKYLQGEMHLIRLTEVLWSYYVMDAITGPCVFVSATK